jgi:hypothetical protein
LLLDPEVESIFRKAETPEASFHADLNLLLTLDNFRYYNKALDKWFLSCLILLILIKSVGFGGHSPDPGKIKDH